MKPPPNGHYSKLYDEIARRRDLSPGARILFSVIMSLGRNSGECYANNGGLARRAGLGVTQVKESLARLEEKGLIVREAKGKRRQNIKVLWKPPEESKAIEEVAGKRPSSGRNPAGEVAGIRPVSGRKAPTGGRNVATGHNDKDRANSQGNRGSFEPVGSKTPILEQTTGDPTLPVEGPRLAGGTDEGGTDNPDEGSAFDWVAFRESLGLSKKPKPGVIAFGYPEPVFSPEEAPIQDDPIIQAALAERREWQRRRAEQNGEAKP